VLGGEVKDLLRLDVTPLTLAIENAGRRGDSDDPAQTRRFRPARTETFSTAADSQTSVEVHVLQGERPMARRTRTLGKFHLDGIPTAPRGRAPDRSHFRHRRQWHPECDRERHGHAKDQKITITSSSGLSKEEVARMAKEADAHSAEDKAQREAIDAKESSSTAWCTTSRRCCASLEIRSRARDRGEVENAVARRQEKALESNDKAQMARLARP